METTNYYLSKDSKTFIEQNNDPNVTRMKTLPPGLYRVHDTAGPMMPLVPGYTPVTIQDSLVNFKAGAGADSIKYINDVFADGIGVKYEEMGIAHKIGILYYGPQGTGKTSVCQLVMRSLVEEKQAICLDLTGKTFSFVQRIVSRIRGYQDNLLVVFCDEIDNSFDQDENGWLTFLDGTHSISNFVLLGATNNLEEIPERIRNRKSRIKHCIEIKSLPFEVYRQYATEKCKSIPTEKLDEYAYLAEEYGLTIDQFKHVLIEVNIFNATAEQAFADAKKFAKI